MGLRPSDIRKLALALPESTEEPHHEMTSFRVVGKIFATMPPEADRVHIFVSGDEVAAYCAEYPGTVEELWWGKRLSGCRLILTSAKATRPLARELLTEAWRHKAPKKLVT
jgi:hypothetical protein